MKKILVMLAAIFALASCSKDNQEPNPAPGVPIVEPQKHYIAKIETYTKVDSRKLEEIVYSYDDQMRLTKVVESFRFSGDEPDQVVTGQVSYDPNVITMEVDEHKYQENLGAPTIYRLTLNTQNQKASKFEHIPVFKESGQNPRVEENYSYNALGQQTGYTSSFWEKVSSVWQNANMIRTTYEREYTAIQTREYTSVSNNVYPDLNLFFSRMHLSPQNKYLWSEQLGIHSKNLQKSVKVTRDGENADYEYQLDAKGRPVRITETTSIAEDKLEYVITYISK